MRDDIFDSLLPFLDELVDIACDHIEAMEKDEDDLCDSESFNIDMVLAQLEEYGKCKGVLHCNEDKCENYIPVSVAKQIVRSRGLDRVLGYLEGENEK